MPWNCEGGWEIVGVGAQWERQSGVLWFGTAEGVGTISQLDKVDDVTMAGDGWGGMEKLKERPQD